MPDKALVGKIAEKLSSYEVVLGFHDLMIHSYGPAITYASVHVEVDAKENVIEMHDAIDNIERDFMNDMNVHLVIHMDPVTIGDPETDNLKSEITGIIKNLNGDLTLHDFRLVKGPTHTNVLFDVVIPYDCKTTLGDIKRALQENVKSETTYYYVINVDRKFTD